MSELLDRLNPSQREAVMHETGPLLIIAGPGSGKTKTVVHSIAYAIENLGVPPGKIGAFTFMRNAVKELKDGVSETVGEDLAKDIRISTFHSFCGQVWKTDFGKLGIGDGRSFTVDELTLIYKERIRSQIDYIQHHQFVDAQEIHNFISECEADNISPEAARDRASNYVSHTQSSQMLEEIYKRYKQTLENGKDNYTKVQLCTNALFRDRPEVKTRLQEKFELIFVDEYQDTDPVQYQIIKTLVEKHQNLRVVGDDDQGIYGWRGADIQNILNFEKDYPNAKVISLGQNYRSTKQIVDVSRAVIDFCPNRRQKRLFTANPDGQKVIHLHCKDPLAEANTIARFISRAIQNGWTTKDFAILCRTNDQVTTFIELFSDMAIPYHANVNASPDMQTNGVSIMTIHKSKGLEFQNVFVAGVCSKLLPHHKSKEEDWDEELRLLYVAMTRAENWLCLSSYDKDETYPRGPSRFLDFIPRRLVERIETLDNTAIPLKFKKRTDPEDVENSQEYAISPLISAHTVLGIDPGKENIGWSITQKLPGGYTVCKYDTERSIGQRIEDKFNELVRLHSPDAICVEILEGATDEWFLHVAGCVAQIRSIADRSGIEWHSYSPQDVKYAVTGNRNASKEAIQHAVKTVCNLKEIPEPHHSADAIAVSLCYLRNFLNYSRFQDNARKQKHYNSGYTHLENGQYNEAITQFEGAINNAPMIDPMYTKAHCGLGRAYLGQDKLVAAEKSAKEALRLDDNYQPALKILESIKQKYCEHGMSYLNQDNLVLAEKSAKEALRLDTNDKLACELLDIDIDVEIEKILANYKPTCEANYKPACELLDAIKQKYYNRGRNHLDNQKYDNAIAAFEKTIIKYPNFTEAYCGLVHAYVGKDKLKEAENLVRQKLRYENHYSLARELLETFKRCLSDRGRKSLRQGDTNAVEEAVAKALILEKDYPTDRVPKSASLQTVVLRLEKSHPPFHELLNAVKKMCYNRGCLHLNKKQYNEAIAEFKIVAGMDPNYMNVQNSLGFAYYWMKDFYFAIDSYTTAIEIDSNDTKAYIMLGLCYIWKGQYGCAVSKFRKAMHIDPHYRLAHLGLGRAYYKLRKFEDAKQATLKLLRIDPTYQRAHNLLRDIEKQN